MTRQMPDTERLTESFDTKAAIRELRQCLSMALSPIPRTLPAGGSGGRV